jgi:hypothetical protein
MSAAGTCQNALMAGALTLGSGVGAMIRAMSDVPTEVLVLVAAVLFAIGGVLFLRGE